MLDPASGLAAIKAVIDAVKSIKAVLPKAEERDRRLQNDVTGALRKLYFTPRGILSLLHQVADGEEITQDRIQQALSDFNDREWQVAEALQRIDFHYLRNEFGLSLATLRVLEQLQYGKFDLRRAVQREVNFYGQSGIKPNKPAAKRLIAAIETLNAEIEDIEGVVNTRAPKGPARKPRAAEKRAAPKKKAAARKKVTRKTTAR
jgi:hypothetical protein